MFIRSAGGGGLSQHPAMYLYTITEEKPSYSIQKDLFSFSVAAKVRNSRCNNNAYPNLLGRP